MLLEGEAWSRYFRDFRSSAFRLELHPVYTMPGEADIQYEFVWGFAYNIESGEDIRVLDLTQDPGPGLLDEYLSYRDAAWRDAIPFRDYWAGLASRV